MMWRVHASNPLWGYTSIQVEQLLVQEVTYKKLNKKKVLCCFWNGIKGLHGPSQIYTNLMVKL